MTHTANAVQQKTLASDLVPTVMFAAVVLTPVQSHAQDALRIAPNSYIGLGIDSPERQLHLRGSNATFRMDRSADTAAFLLVRTNPAGTPLKTFVVGANAAGTNNGEFVINDLRGELAGQQAHVAQLEARLAGFEAVRDRLAEIEGLLAGERGPAVFAQR